jgi:protein TonB
MKKALRAKLPMLLGAGVLVLFVAGLIWMIKGFIDNADPPAKRQVQQISLVKPPPPKVEEKPPEPPKQEIKEEVPLDQPNPQPEANNEPPPDESVGSNLGPGTDGFGLGKGNGSGRIGGGGSRARWYAGLIGDRFEQTLNRDAKLLEELKSKRITVRIWVDGSGRVERVELDKGALPGNTEQELKEKLLAVSIQESPEGVEQPIWYRFRPRG